MSDLFKMVVSGFVLILLIACFKRQRRYWREMQQSKPTGSLKAGYKLAILTVFLSLGAACYSNSPAGWELFTAILLMTVVFCVKITFSPSVIAIVLGICTYQMYVNDRFPFFEVWGAAISVIAWRLPEEFRIVYTTLSFIWVMVIVLSGGTPDEAATATPDDIADATSILHH